MSHFYGEVNGQAGTRATRIGSKKSKIQAHLHGWNVGVSVIGYYDTGKDQDVFCVYSTGGSNGAKPQEKLATIYEDGEVVIHKE